MRAAAVHVRRLLVLASTAVIAGCGGPQSALSPAGRDAESIAALFAWMTGGAVVIWLVVMGLAVFAILSEKKRDPKKVRRLVIGGGIVVPFLVLTVLVVLGLEMMPRLLAYGDEGGMEIRVTGHQWWWRVAYEMPDGSRIELANEIRVANGRRTSLWLETADVIHSLWIPSLGGKIDMIPGHVNRMALEPTRPGVFRGACAEYCGASHAKMMLSVVVVEPAELEAWLEAQKAPARPPEGETAARGAALFTSLGCGACHTVRGTDARGVVGPDLTHVGSRLGVGAGILENRVEDFEAWLVATKRLKPGVHMPAFDMLSPADIQAVAVFLEGLQ